MYGTPVNQGDDELLSLTGGDLVMNLTEKSNRAKMTGQTYSYKLTATFPACADGTQSFFTATIEAYLTPLCWAADMVPLDKDGTAFANEIQLVSPYTTTPANPWQSVSFLDYLSWQTSSSCSIREMAVEWECDTGTDHSKVQSSESGTSAKYYTNTYTALQEIVLYNSVHTCDGGTTIKTSWSGNDQDPNQCMGKNADSYTTTAAQYNKDCCSIWPNGNNPVWYQQMDFDQYYEVHHIHFRTFVSDGGLVPFDYEEILVSDGITEQLCFNTNTSLIMNTWYNITCPPGLVGNQLRIKKQADQSNKHIRFCGVQAFGFKTDNPNTCSTGSFKTRLNGWNYISSAYNYNSFSYMHNVWPSSTSTTNPYIVNTQTTDTRMKIDVRNDAYSALVEGFRIKLTSQHQNIGYYSVKVLVCGSQSISTTATYASTFVSWVSSNQKILKVVAAAGEGNVALSGDVNKWAVDLQPFFQSTENSQAFIDSINFLDYLHQQCMWIVYSLWQNQACTSAYPTSTIKLDDFSGAQSSAAIDQWYQDYPQYLSVDITAPITQTTLYLKVSNLGQYSLMPVQKVMIYVCGAETINSVAYSYTNTLLHAEVIAKIETLDTWTLYGQTSTFIMSPSVASNLYTSPITSETVNVVNLFPTTTMNAECPIHKYEVYALSNLVTLVNPTQMTETHFTNKGCNNAASILSKKNGVSWNQVWSCDATQDCQYGQGWIGSWWQADFAESNKIAAIRIFRRTDCCANRGLVSITIGSTTCKQTATTSTYYEHDCFEVQVNAGDSMRITSTHDHLNICGLEVYRKLESTELTQFDQMIKYDNIDTITLDQSKFVNTMPQYWEIKIKATSMGKQIAVQNFLLDLRLLHDKFYFCTSESVVPVPYTFDDQYSLTTNLHPLIIAKIESLDEWSNYAHDVTFLLGPGVNDGLNAVTLFPTTNWMPHCPVLSYTIDGVVTSTSEITLINPTQSSTPAAQYRAENVISRINGVWVPIGTNNKNTMTCTHQSNNKGGWWQGQFAASHVVSTVRIIKRSGPGYPAYTPKIITIDATACTMVPENRNYNEFDYYEFDCNNAHATNGSILKVQQTNDQKFHFCGIEVIENTDNPIPISADLVNFGKMATIDATFQVTIDVSKFTTQFPKYFELKVTGHSAGGFTASQYFLMDMRLLHDIAFYCGDEVISEHSSNQTNFFLTKLQPQTEVRELIKQHNQFVNFYQSVTDDKMYLLGPEIPEKINAVDLFSVDQPIVCPFTTYEISTRQIELFPGQDQSREFNQIVQFDNATYDITIDPSWFSPEYNMTIWPEFEEGVPVFPDFFELYIKSITPKKEMTLMFIVDLRFLHFKYFYCGNETLQAKRPQLSKFLMYPGRIETIDPVFYFFTDQVHCPVVNYTISPSEDVKGDHLKLFHEMVKMNDTFVYDKWNGTKVPVLSDQVNWITINPDVFTKEFPLFFRLYVTAKSPFQTEQLIWFIDMEYLHNRDNIRTFNRPPTLMEPSIYVVNPNFPVDIQLYNAIADYQKDQMTLTFDGLEEISNFATVEVGEQNLLEGLVIPFWINIRPYKIQPNQIKDHIIKIEATDGIDTSEFEITIRVLKEKLQEQEVVEEQEQVAQVVKRKAIISDKYYPPPSIKFSKITPRGEIMIDFNQPFFPPLDFKTQNYSSTFKVQIQSSLDRSVITGTHYTYQNMTTRKLQNVTKQPQIKGCDESCEAEKFDFLWYVKSHDEDGMVIKLEFEDSSQISVSSYGQDGLGLDIQDYSLFQSSVQDKTLERSGVQKTECGSIPAVMCALMPPIIDSEDLINSIDSASETLETGVEVVTIFGMITSIFLGGILQRLFGLVKVVQIILLCAVIAVVYPGTLTYFYSLCVQLTDMDLLQGELIYEKVFDFKETPAYSPVFMQYDMGDLNYFMNSGSMLIIIVLVFFNWVFWSICHFISVKFYLKHKFFRKLGMLSQDKIYFTLPISRLFVELYVDIVLAAFLNGYALFYEYKENQEELDEFYNGVNLMSSIVTLVSLFFVFMIPVYILIVILRNYDKLEMAHTLKRYGVYYEDYKYTEGRMIAAFTVIMMVRRIVLIYTIMGLKDITWFQCDVLSATSLISLSLLLHFKPFKDKESQTFEVFNESTILINCILQKQFMQEANVIEDRLKLVKVIFGYLIIFNICFNVLINLSTVGIQTIKIIFKSSSDKYTEIKAAKDKQKYNETLDMMAKKLGQRYVDMQNEKKGEEEAITFCRQYAKERQWCYINNLEYKYLPDEKIFQAFVEKYQFRERRKMILEEMQMRQAVQNQNVANIHENRRAKFEKKFMESQANPEQFYRYNYDHDNEVFVKPKQSLAEIMNKKTKVQQGNPDLHLSNFNSTISNVKKTKKWMAKPVIDTIEEENIEDSHRVKVDFDSEEGKPESPKLKRKSSKTGQTSFDNSVDSLEAIERDLLNDIQDKFNEIQQKPAPLVKPAIEDKSYTLQWGPESVEVDDKSKKIQRAKIDKEAKRLQKKLIDGFENDKILERTDYKMNIPGALMPETFDLKTLENIRRISENQGGETFQPIKQAIENNFIVGLKKRQMRERELIKRINLLKDNDLVDLEHRDQYFEETFDFIQNYDLELKAQEDAEMRGKEFQKNKKWFQKLGLGSLYDMIDEMFDFNPQHQVAIVYGREYLFKRIQFLQQMIPSIEISEQEKEKWLRHSKLSKWNVVEGDDYGGIKICRINNEVPQKFVSLVETVEQMNEMQGDIKSALKIIDKAGINNQNPNMQNQNYKDYNRLNQKWNKEQQSDLNDKFAKRRISSQLSNAANHEYIDGRNDDTDSMHGENNVGHQNRFETQNAKMSVGAKKVKKVKKVVKVKKVKKVKVKKKREQTEELDEFQEIQ